MQPLVGIKRNPIFLSFSLVVSPLHIETNNKMKFSKIALSATLSLLPSLTQGTLLSYDTVYDNPKGSLTTVACSDGSYGLLTRGYKTFGNLPRYPYIGGSDLVKGWNSPNCGSCHQLTYTNATGFKSVINVLVVDVAVAGFNVAQRAMDDLTGGHAVAIGVANVTAKQVNPSVCGL